MDDHCKVIMLQYKVCVCYLKPEKVGELLSRKCFWNVPVTFSISLAVASDL